MFIRQSFVYLSVVNRESVMFILEMALFIIPFIMFMMDRVVTSQLYLFIASTLVIAGVVVNRINNFVIAYHPPYAKSLYSPSFGEVSVTLGFIAIMVLIYRACVMIFPVISVEKGGTVTGNNVAGGSQ
jgi:Ni/Fe-hydrogenase subunit HybB-like protein